MNTSSCIYILGYIGHYTYGDSFIFSILFKHHVSRSSAQNANSCLSYKINIDHQSSQNCQGWLVVWTHLKNMKVSWVYHSPRYGKIIQSCSSHHQPARYPLLRQNHAFGFPNATRLQMSSVCAAAAWVAGAKALTNLGPALPLPIVCTGCIW